MVSKKGNKVQKVQSVETPEEKATRLKGLVAANAARFKEKCKQDRAWGEEEQGEESGDTLGFVLMDLRNEIQATWAQQANWISLRGYTMSKETREEVKGLLAAAGGLPRDGGWLVDRSSFSLDKLSV
mgnify:CR=1 FL=1